MKTLIADDNPVFQNVLKSMLVNWGYDVVVAGNGDEAWDILQGEDSPKLAILDWMMPGLDGIEVCRLVRSRMCFGYTYILILTGKTQSEDLLVAMDAGADDYVTKPFKSQELRARLRAGCRILELEEQLLLARQVPLPVHRPTTLPSC